MSLIIILVLLALLLGGVGLAVDALQWLLFIALILLVWGAIAGVGVRGRGRY